MTMRSRPVVAGLGALTALTALAVIGGAAFTRTSRFGGSASGARLSRMVASPQWRDDRFHNPQPQWMSLWSAMRSAMAGRNPNSTPATAVPAQPTARRLLDTPPTTGLRVTWFGHSCTLVEVDGVRVLTDPFWGDRASPISWVGPRRWFAATITLDDLPPVAAVVISHDHYDHLDEPTIRAMAKWDTVFVVGLGVGAHLARWGIRLDRIRELDWWESTDVAQVTITATPARHASGRLGVSTNLTLWAGWAIAGPRHRVWYSGDTGFHDQITEIGERLGPFDLTLVETGQYNAGWVDSHLGPEQAIAAHIAARGRVLLPMHWGLLNLSPHTWTEPIERALAAAARSGTRLIAPRPGEPVEPGTGHDPADVERWWPKLPGQNAAEAPIVATRAGDPAVRYPVPKA